MGKQTLIEARYPETHAPLDAGKARHFEAQLGADFSGVQIHSGDGVAEDHGAAAVAFGRDIHFARGLQGDASDALLGHELVHTVQQGAVPSRHGGGLRARAGTWLLRRLNSAGRGSGGATHRR